MVLRTTHLRWALLALLIAPASIAGLVRAGAPSSEQVPERAALAATAARTPTGAHGRAAGGSARPRPGSADALPASVRRAPPRPLGVDPAPLRPPTPAAGADLAPEALCPPLSTRRVWPALLRAAEALDTALVPLTTGLRVLDPRPLAAAEFVAKASAATRTRSLEEVQPVAPWEEDAGPRPATRVLAELSLPASLPAPVSLRTSDDPTWRSLDSRLYRMRTIAFNGGFEVGVSGFLKMTAGRYEMENLPDDRSSQALSFDAARLHFAGETDDVRLFLSVAGEDRLGGGFIAKDSVAGELSILDAYAQFELADWVELQVGSFRSPVLFSSGLDDNELLFINRTYSSLFWQDRDEGAMLHGQVADRFDWWLAVQNGVDGSADEVAATVRGSLRVFGEGEAPRREGAYDADLGQTLYVGASYHDDGSVDDYDVLSADAHYTFDRLSLSAEVADYGAGSLNHRQWSTTGAFMFVPDTWEVALRYEDFGTRADDLLQLGLNRYLRDFHSRVQLVVGRFEHDRGGDAVTRVELGVVVSL